MNLFFFVDVILYYQNVQSNPTLMNAWHGRIVGIIKHNLAWWQVMHCRIFAGSEKLYGKIHDKCFEFEYVFLIGLIMLFLF